MVAKRIMIMMLATGIAGCASPARRIEACQAAGETEEKCVADEWAYESAHPLPKFEGTGFDGAAALQAAYNADAAKGRD